MFPPLYVHYQLQGHHPHNQQCCIGRYRAEGRNHPEREFIKLNVLLFLRIELFTQQFEKYTSRYDAFQLVQVNWFNIWTHITISFVSASIDGLTRKKKTSFFILLSIIAIFGAQKMNTWSHKTSACLLRLVEKRQHWSIFLWKWGRWTITINGDNDHTMITDLYLLLMALMWTTFGFNRMVQFATHRMPESIYCVK